MLSRFEMLRLDRLLRLLNSAADQPRLDGNALLHPQPLEQGRDPLLGEDAHQVVFERQIEARGARVTLAASASAKLVVNTARFMALSAKNEQAAGRNDLFVFLIRLRFITMKCLFPLVRGY